MLTYWFSELPAPEDSKAYEISIFGYDVDNWNRIFGAKRREDEITKRILRKLSAEAIINVILKS